MPKILSGKYVNGNSVFTQDRDDRWIDAVGKDVVKYINDFVQIGSAADWTLTVVDSASAGKAAFVAGDGSGGFLSVVTNAKEDDGTNFQLGSEAFELTADQVIYFGAFGVSASDAKQSDLFLGLAITDTDILGGVTDRIGFESLDGSTALAFLAEKDATETNVANVATLANGVGVDLEFFCDSAARLKAYVNNVLVADTGGSLANMSIANLPNDEQLKLSGQFLAGENAAKTLLIDKLSVIQVGR